MKTVFQHVGSSGISSRQKLNKSLLKSVYNVSIKTWEKATPRCWSQWVHWKCFVIQRPRLGPKPCCNRVCWDEEWVEDHWMTGNPLRQAPTPSAFSDTHTHTHPTFPPSEHFDVLLSRMCTDTHTHGHANTGPHVNTQTDGPINVMMFLFSIKGQTGGLSVRHVISRYFINTWRLSGVLTAAGCWAAGWSSSRVDKYSLSC